MSATSLELELPASPFGLRQAEPDGAAPLTVGLARGAAEVAAAQRLRHQVFAEELGARLTGARDGHDADGFDPYCAHLVVRDGEGRVVATTRLLTPEQADVAGGYYSAGEFDLRPLLASGAHLLEIGRTCVHRDHRGGAALAMLWQGLARCVDLGRYDWLMGCASIPLDPERGDAVAAYRMLAPRYLVDPALRVTPLRAVPESAGATAAAMLPPLLLAYLRLGARIGGEPCWDPDFGVADLLVLVDPKRIESRYARHFIRG
jgi:putative hemolysin